MIVNIAQEVWFQNKRSKERRLKQLTSMGRGPFFGGARKMRGFPMNLSPGGLDEPGFPYFAADGKFDFGYGGPPFHPHDAPFFGGHPGAGPMPFGGPGGPMDHPIPMVGDFVGGMAGPDGAGGAGGGPGMIGPGGGPGGPGGFMGQPGGPGGPGGGGNPQQQQQQGHGPDGVGGMLPSSRPGGSPVEFLTSGNFSESQNMQNEGLVW
uniref:Homeobox domain-containing protein n=1 Tax=Anopheles minimus TaxID=112268 RepID=A0A182WDL0_9DIPT